MLAHMERSSTNLAKWGTRLAVRIPRAIVEAAQLKRDDELEIELQNRKTVIQAVANKPTLQQLIDGITPESCHPATDRTQPVGNEAG